MQHHEHAMINARGDGQDTAARGAEVEAQTLKLAKELAEYKAESKGLKNQELTIRRLEERHRTLEAELAAKASLHLLYIACSSMQAVLTAAICMSAVITAISTTRCNWCVHAGEQMSAVSAIRTHHTLYAAVCRTGSWLRSGTQRHRRRRLRRRLMCQPEQQRWSMHCSRRSRHCETCSCGMTPLSARSSACRCMAPPAGIWHCLLRSHPCWEQHQAILQHACHVSVRSLCSVDSAADWLQ